MFLLIMSLLIGGLFIEWAVRGVRLHAAMADYKFQAWALQMEREKDGIKFNDYWRGPIITGRAKQE